MRIVDANIVLRYLLDDEQQLSSQAAAILEKEAVHLPFEVLAEVVYVMQGVYAVPRDKINETLQSFLASPGITTNSTPVASEALRLYADKKIDFVDALLCAYHRVDRHEIETFDKKLRNCCK